MRSELSKYQEAAARPRILSVLDRPSASQHTAMLRKLADELLCSIAQNSSDFARMLQALDDQCFDAAQLEYERLQRPCGF